MSKSPARIPAPRYTPYPKQPRFIRVDQLQDAYDDALETIYRLQQTVAIQKAEITRLLMLNQHQALPARIIVDDDEFGDELEPIDLTSSDSDSDSDSDSEIDFGEVDLSFLD